MIGLNYTCSACAWIAITLTISALVYSWKMNRDKDKKSGIIYGMTTFVILLVGIPIILNGINYLLRGEWRTYTTEDIVGEWEVHHQQYGCWEYSGIEKVVIQPSGTYDQSFVDIYGQEMVVSENNWHWQTEQQIVLQDAKSLPYHFENACDLESTDRLSLLFAQDGQDRKLSILTDFSALDKLTLETEPVGDPDAPQTTRFYRNK